ncbi:hypothetical protein NLA06_07185 [Desulfomicrobium sp. ZS1]|uniref:hypothetical protein n=1 Tax=Desulfomicrobium sp. ZS1 TaxID=2952228 RepID=UPI0020B3C540|nr:hypothetical protein [Desulfomicrobium sp. ZS1]UTF51662.1 hypothetical protein NLA06_07185 [Desulfomicrobium sp. ZS1]
MREFGVLPDALIAIAVAIPLSWTVLLTGVFFANPRQNAVEDDGSFHDYFSTI